MPASIKLQEAFGDDLQVVFVESQGTPVPATEAFVISHKWMGGKSMWTHERPFDTGSNGLPNFVLLGNDGTVLLKGNPLGQPKEIERQIAEQVKLRKSAPPTTHKSVKTAWSEFNKGKLAKGLEIARTVAADAAAKEDAVTAAQEAISAFEKRVSAELKRASWMIESGYFDEASSLLDTLRKGVKGDAELEKTVGEAATKLDAPELKAERDAAKAFGRLAARYFEAGGDPAVKKELDGFAKKNAGTKAAARAQHLAGLPKG